MTDELTRARGRITLLEAAIRAHQLSDSQQVEHGANYCVCDSCMEHMKAEHIAMVAAGMAGKDVVTT